MLERDAVNSYLAGDAVDDDPLAPLLGHSIAYCLAVGPQAGHKVFTLQMLPTCDEPFGAGKGRASRNPVPFSNTNTCSRTCATASPWMRHSERDSMRADYCRLGLTLGKHPVALIRHRETFRLCQSADLKQARHGQRVRVAGLVTNRQRPQTASGVLFMTLEDGNTM